MVVTSVNDTSQATATVPSMKPPWSPLPFHQWYLPGHRYRSINDTSPVTATFHQWNLPGHSYCSINDTSPVTATVPSMKPPQSPLPFHQWNLPSHSYRSINNTSLATATVPSMTPPWSVYLPSNTMMEFQIFGSLLFRALGFFPPEPQKTS